MAYMARLEPAKMMANVHSIAFDRVHHVDSISEITRSASKIKDDDIKKLMKH